MPRKGIQGEVDESLARNPVLVVSYRSRLVILGIGLRGARICEEAQTPNFECVRIHLKELNIITASSVESILLVL